MFNHIFTSPTAPRVWLDVLEYKDCVLTSDCVGFKAGTKIPKIVVYPALSTIIFGQGRDYTFNVWAEAKIKAVIE